MDILDNSDPIDPEAEPYVSLLHNLQGNILKGHGRDNAVLIFFRFVSPAEEVRLRLIDLLQCITSAGEQLAQAKQFKSGVPGGLFANFFLSASGYEYLGFGDEQFKTAFPWKESSSFCRGMKSVKDLRLDDPAIEDWEDAYQGRIDAMLLLADDDPALLLNRKHEVIDQVEQFAKVVTTEHGAALRDEEEEGFEHFGFTDGLSQPIFFAADMPEKIDRWSPAAPLRLALVKDRTITDGSAFGSFFVFRKLEQDVRGFITREREIAHAMGLEGNDRERVGAMVVGRFRDGTPLALSDAAGLPPNQNDFTYFDDKDGAKCPFHAHTRKINPRGEMHNMDPLAQKGLRIVRRGIPYGVWSGPPEDQPLENLPSGGVGLLFMCFQAVIETQFNFIQESWANTASFREDGAGRDALVGQGEPKAQQWPQKYGTREPHHDATFAGFVKMKGGEYFFAPSIPFLRKLAP